METSRLCGRWPAMALLLLANAVAFHETRRTNHARDNGKVNPWTLHAPKMREGLV